MNDDAEENAGVRGLPSVDAVLRTTRAVTLVERFGHAAVVNAIRVAIAAARAESGTALTAEDAAEGAADRLEAEQAPRLRRVFNLTGTVLHTNLGRAILAEEAVEAASAAMRSAVALEFDLGGGRRGERDDVLRDLLCGLTGAQAATVVNNNAAAVLLTLNTLARGRGAIVSRGELIEIGGAFRMPEIMSRAGARLVEVGTTNRTHRHDYVDAIDERTGVLLKVHTSNYRVEGFTAEVPACELATLARERGIPLIVDLGSGTLLDPTRWGLPHEPTVAEVIAAGADLVTFSGDKLLGGPQAGFIVGRSDLIARINRNPLKRVLRIDKIRLAAIEATLRLYRDPDRLSERLPTLRALTRSYEEIDARARRLAPAVAQVIGDAYSVDVLPCASQVGSGAVPIETLRSAALAIRPAAIRGAGRALTRLAAALRRLPVPVIGRISDQALLLDLRCLEDEHGFLENLEALRSVRHAVAGPADSA
ncbi:MAG TPA: L-seryl-tRNA(Sec) selenium transferase [Steroidobacteraceae bacterium]|nr:L-seryl-tRNA(Sec) selenium transferase [Steroidobacteraceae bacterium]